MKWPIFLYAFILCYASSCSTKEKNDFTPAQPSVVPEHASSLEVWERNESESSKDFISEETQECRYVFLQDDNPNYIVGGIDQIFANDSSFTIIDKSFTERIIRYDKEGRYLRTIGAKGKANGEYVGLGCADLTKDGNIVITDGLSGRLIVYSSEGEFKEEFRMNRLMPHSMALSDTIILGSFPGYNRSSKFRIKWIDFNDKEVDTALPFTSERSYVAGNLIPDRSGKVFFNYPLNDTIFMIDGKKIIPAIAMNIHDSKLTDDFIRETESLDDKDYHKNLYSNDRIVNLVELIKCDNKWVVYYQKGKNTYVSFVSDHGKKRTNYPRASITDRNKGEFFIPEMFVGYADGYLIGYIDPEAFSYLDDKRKAEYLKRMKDNGVNAPQNDEDIANYGNLILCLYKLKQ